MSWQITQDIYSNKQVFLRRDGQTWRGQATFHGGSGTNPETIMSTMVDMIVINVAAEAEKAKPIKGKATVGMQLLQQIRDADRAISQAQAKLAQAQAKLQEIAAQRAATLRDSDGTALLDALAAHDAAKLRALAILDQLAMDQRTKEQARAALLPGFRVDRDTSIHNAINKEVEQAQQDIATAYADLERSIGPHLTKVAEAQARLAALQGDTLWGETQGRLEQMLTPPVGSMTSPTAMSAKPVAAVA
jgi:hypothetical protein